MGIQDQNKPRPDGSTRYNARLVVKGYYQVKRIDYKETYAPVSRPASLCALLAFASTNGCDHMGVVAFLHPGIDQTDVLMNLPELHDLGDLSEFDLSNTDKYQMLRLRKALCGLKQSPRPWHKEPTLFWILGNRLQNQTSILRIAL